MKTIILTAILVLTFTAGSVYAFATYTTRTNSSFVKITNQLVDTETVTVYRFEEKIGSSTVTCFGTFASRNTNIGKIVDSTSISCVK
jgi:uncharacterized protein YxeA